MPILDVVALCRPIVEALGSDYTLEQPYDDNEGYASLTFHPVGLTFGITRAGYGTCTKLRVHVRSPKMPNGNTMWLMGPMNQPLGPEIHFNYTRDPKAVAQDIRRRFVQPWMTVWPGVMAKWQHMHVVHDLAEQQIERLARIIGEKPYQHHRGQFRAGGDVDRVYAEIETYPDARSYRKGQVDLKLSGLTEEQAAAILAIVVGTGSV